MSLPDILNHEASIRMGSFFAIFTFMSGWEMLAPRRVLTTSKGIRWFSNLSIVFLNSVSLRLIFPILAMDVAFLAAERNWGLLNNIAIPYWLAVTIGVVALDFVIYLQHVMFHAVPALWRLHMMHHADLDFDVTTGLRFHPIEIFLSMVIKIATVSVLGPPVVAVLFFEVLLNGTSMFNHGNVQLSLRVDRILRLFVVTPEMHRVHHSVIIRETNSNFGFNLPWWDRLFGTYKGQPAAGHVKMTIGLSHFRDPKGLTLHRLIILPFIGKTGKYPLGS